MFVVLLQYISHKFGKTAEVVIFVQTQRQHVVTLPLDTQFRLKGISYLYLTRCSFGRPGPVALPVGPVALPVGPMALPVGLAALPVGPVALPVGP